MTSVKGLSQKVSKIYCVLLQLLGYLTIMLNMLVITIMERFQQIFDIGRT